MPAPDVLVEGKPSGLLVALPCLPTAKAALADRKACLIFTTATDLKIMFDPCCDNIEMVVALMLGIGRVINILLPGLDYTFNAYRGLRGITLTL